MLESYAAELVKRAGQISDATKEVMAACDRFKTIAEQYLSSTPINRE